MRTINEIIIHCSATREGLPVTVDDIRRFHVMQRGWRDIGYHYVVTLDGAIHVGRPESQVGAHCLGHNAHSIGVCYVGGVDGDGRPKDTRNAAQKAALRALVKRLQAKYRSATVHGHCEFANKACPCFDVRAEFAP